MTCCEPATQPNKYETTLQVGGLKQHAWSMFTRGNRVVTETEKKQLANTKPDMQVFPEEYQKPDGSLIDPKYFSHDLGKHHLFTLLDRNAHAIKATAVFWNGRPNLTLVDLYHFVAE